MAKTLEETRKELKVVIAESAFKYKLRDDVRLQDQIYTVVGVSSFKVQNEPVRYRFFLQPADFRRNTDCRVASDQ